MVQEAELHNSLTGNQVQPRHFLFHIPTILQLQSMCSTQGLMGGALSKPDAAECPITTTACLASLYLGRSWQSLDHLSHRRPAAYHAVLVTFSIPIPLAHSQLPALRYYGTLCNEDRNPSVCEDPTEQPTRVSVHGGSTSKCITPNESIRP